MIAFVAAMGAEMQSHETFFAQFHDHVFSARFRVLVDYCGVVYAVDAKRR